MTDEENGRSLPEVPFGVEIIERALPHRHPFLLLDRVVAFELEPEKKITAIKNVTVNEPFFPGHFPGHPVMPGVLIIEAMAQAAGVLGALSVAKLGGENLYYLAKVTEAKFNRLVTPGDQLVLEVMETRRMRKMGIFKGRALVDGQRVASAELLCAGRS